MLKNAMTAQLRTIKKSLNALQQRCPMLTRSFALLLYLPPTCIYCSGYSAHSALGPFKAVDNIDFERKTHFASQEIPKLITLHPCFFCILLFMKRSIQWIEFGNFFNSHLIFFYCFLTKWVIVVKKNHDFLVGMLNCRQTTFEKKCLQSF